MKIEVTHMHISVRLILIVVTVILVAGCDRFEHSFAPPTYPLVEQFYANLSDSLLLITDTNVEPISGFYAVNYLNNGMDKAQIEQFYRNLFINHPNGIIVPDSTYEFEPASQGFTWRLRFTNLAGDTTFVDTLFTDKIVFQNGKYQFIGNQVNPSNNTKQKVLAQMVTGTWCSNCTAIEAALHQCELRYPGQFYYVEHHLNDSLQVNPQMSDFLAYYGGIYSAPTTVFQGITKYTLTNTGSLDQFSALIQSLLTQDAKFTLANFNFTLVGDSLSGAVDVTPTSTTTHTNLVLNFAIAEEETAALNYAGLPCRNVIRNKGEKDISSIPLPGTVTFKLHLPNYRPPDSKIVIWVQTMNHPWDQQSLIYNVLEQEITLSK
jgi:hypothetical protein